MAENLINLGSGQAEEWFIKCCQYDPNSQAKELEARLFLRTGRLSEVVKVLDLGKDTVRQDQSLPQAHRETDALLSIAYAFLGEANKAKHYAQGSIMHGIKLKAPFVEACGWMRMGHAAQLQPNTISKQHENAMKRR